MKTRWEYLRVTWEHATNYATKSATDAQTWETLYRIYRGGAEPEQLPGDGDWTDLANKLGGEGWELVSESIQDSAVVSGAHGWPNAGVPILVSWTFKRPLVAPSRRVSTGS
jgi:hypothetical protein